MLDVAVIGLGRWGQTLVRSIQTDGSPKKSLIRVVASFTRSPEKAAEFIAKERIKNFSSYEELLSSKTVQAVLIASPHSQHVAQIQAAAAAGLHVFCEKPLALDMEGATVAVSACRQANVLLAVGFNRRFLPAYQSIKSLVESGSLGRILHVEGSFSGPFGLSYGKEVWHANPAETPAGGMTLMGVHVLDAMIGVAGHISKVNARSRRQHLQVSLDDTTDATIEFRSGCTGYLSTLTATARQWRLQVSGTKGWAQMTDQDKLIVSMVGTAPVESQMPTVSLEQLELEAFADAVAARKAYPVPIDDVLNGIASLQAIYNSSANGESATVQ